MPNAVKAWTRTTPLGERGQSQQDEIWTYREGHEAVASFDVEVTIGKPLDVLALKGTSLKEIGDYSNFLRCRAEELYQSARETRAISICPCCDADTRQATEALSVFGVRYSRCRQCGHVFIHRQPTAQSLSELFADSEEHSSTYVDRDSLEVRLSQVVKPKLEWVSRAYFRCYGREVKSLFDVGAGGGHFIEVSRRAGIDAGGYEVSKASRKFAKEVFDIELRSDDYLAEGDKLSGTDVITFWGLLEYTPEPRRFIEVARKQIASNEGMLIVEVPRFDCVGTTIQGQCPNTVARHLDPTSHVNCFSDASLATALYLEGFKPVAAWYFGMDAYELLVQLSFELGDPKVLRRLSHLIPGLQASFDLAQACDDIIVAAVPLKT